MYTLILILHLISAIALIGIVLLQAGKGGGLSGAFGSGMGSETLFGARTGDVLTKATAVMATIFILTSLGMAYMSVRSGSRVSEKIRQEQREEQRQKQILEMIQQKAAEEAAKKQEAAPAEKPAETPAPAPAPEAEKPATPPPAPPKTE